MKADDALTESTPTSPLPRWWWRVGWFAPGLMLVTGVNLVVESYERPIGWGDIALRVIGFAGLMLVPAMIVDLARHEAERREVAARPPAEPPRGVRAVMGDGRTVPIECVYRGWQPHAAGLHVWTAVRPLDGLPVRIDADELPPYTTVMGPAARDGA